MDDNAFTQWYNKNDPNPALPPWENPEIEDWTRQRQHTIRSAYLCSGFLTGLFLMGAAWYVDRQEYAAKPAAAPVSVQPPACEK